MFKTVLIRIYTWGTCWTCSTWLSVDYKAIPLDFRAEYSSDKNDDISQCKQLYSTH